MEILFTKYKIVNPTYEQYWNRLIKNNEQIARYNPVGAVKTMKGITLEKYHAMEHRYPSKVDLIDRIGYDPKQLSHLVRVREYLSRYTKGEPYAKCLITEMPAWIKAIKRTDIVKYTLPEARELAEIALKQVVEMADKFSAIHKDEPVDWHVDVLLDDVQRDIMKLGIELEMQKGK